MSGKRAKAERKKEREGLIQQMFLQSDFEYLDVWTDPDSGEIFFAPKEDKVGVFPKAEEPEKEYPDDPRPICTGCGKRQNETHYVPIMKSGAGGFFTCHESIDKVQIING